MSELVLYTLDDGIARIAINRPGLLNAMDEATGLALLTALRRAASESRAVVLTGEGRSFCSGADLDAAREMIELPERDGGAQLESAFNPCILTMREMAQPVITAVRGVAAGVGCGIAMAGDIILCSETAYFFNAFCKVGLVPDGGSSWLLSKAIGRVRAIQLMLLGEKLPAETALQWGLVTRVVPDAELEEAAFTVARIFATGPKSLGLIKRLAWDALEYDLRHALAKEREAQRTATQTEDFVEGIRAFGEARKPRFLGN